MKQAIPALLMLMLLPGCDNSPRSAAPCLEMAWVRLPAMAGRPGAAYFILQGGARDTRLVRISTPDADRAEMHGPGMRRLGAQTVGRRSELEFDPGGRHVMLYGLREGLRPMDQVSLTFHFDSEGDLTERVVAVATAFPDRPEGAVQSGKRRC